MDQCKYSGDTKVLDSHHQLFQELTHTFETASHAHFKKVHENHPHQISTQSALSDVELTHESHHTPILRMLEHLVQTMPQKDLPLLYHFADQLKRRCESAVQKGNDTEREHASQLFDAVAGIHEEVKQKILMSLEKGASDNMDHDSICGLLAETERAEISDLLGSDERDNLLQGRSMEQKQMFYDLLHQHELHHEAQKDTHKNIQTLAEQEGKTQFSHASEQDYEHFFDTERVPLAMREATACISRAFSGVDHWAIIGSLSVAVQADKSPESVDDIDITCSMKDLEHIRNNLNGLKKDGKVFTDQQGEHLGYYCDPVDIYGNNVLLKGFVDSGVPDPKNPGKNILVEFEAFAEAEYAGITQLGSLEKDVTLMEFGGDQIHFIGKEGLTDQYICNLLFEFDQSGIDNFKAGSRIKAKDIMRIEKLRLLGCKILEGIMEAIERTCTKYGDEKQSHKLKKILESKTQIIAILNKGDEEFRDFLRTHGEPAERETTVDYYALHTEVKGYKYQLGKLYEDLMMAQGADEIHKTYSEVEKSNKRFLGMFQAINPQNENAILQFLEIKRLVSMFLTNTYQRIAERLAFFSKDTPLDPGMCSGVQMYLTSQFTS